MTGRDGSRPGDGAARLVATLDAGNGSLKAALWSWPDGRGDGAVRVAADGGPREFLRAAWTDADALAAVEALLDAADVALVSCVAGPARRAALDERLARAGLVDATPAHGLDLGACRRVETIGADRLWAARGALGLTGGAPCLVVDAGTAVTVDAARGDAFLGGAIALGTAPTARALAGEGAGLFDVDVPRDGHAVPALGRESAEALRAGVVHGVRGAVRELAAAVAREADLDADAARLVTGGDAELVLAEPSCVPGAVHVPRLVSLGLLAAWSSAERAS